jgi:hypothetical protein
MTLMIARNCKVSYLAWMMTSSCRNRGTTPIVDGSAGLGTIQPTSVGMTCRCTALAVIRMADLSTLLLVPNNMLKVRKDDPMMAWVDSHDHTHVGIFSIASNTL